jgi:hypothetical protein
MTERFSHNIGRLHLCIDRNSGRGREIEAASNFCVGGAQLSATAGLLEGGKDLEGVDGVSPTSPFHVRSLVAITGGAYRSKEVIGVWARLCLLVAALLFWKLP